MILRFRNGEQFNVSNQSTKTCIIAVENSYEKVGEIADNFAPNNLIGAYLGDEVLENIVPVSVTTERNWSDGVLTSIVIKLNSREKTDVEILTEKVNDTEDALLELAEMIVGGEE